MDQDRFIELARRHVALPLEFVGVRLLFLRAAGAQAVDRAVAHERDQPAEERAPGAVEQLGAAPQVQEHVLHQVLGLGGIADDPEAETVDHARMAVVQRAQRVRVAGTDPLHELGIECVGLGGQLAGGRKRQAVLGWEP